MTLYALSNSVGVREGTFAWYEDCEEEYWFNGATFTKNGWVPNSISWDRYYIMTSNQGIGVRDDRIALVKNGKEALAVHLSQFKTEPILNYRPSWGATMSELIKDDPKYWSAWHKIKELLETACPSQESQEVLSVMNKWEAVSHQTILRVRETLKDQADPQDTVEIYVAGHQWLWHNTTRGVVITGHQEKVWGSAHLHSGGAIITSGALPIHNGWLVGIDPRNKYLLRWNGHSIETSAFIFPGGPWEDLGVWRLWFWDQIVLTSQNRLVAAPQSYYYERDYLNWMCFEADDLEDGWLFINHQGEMFYLDLSEYPDPNLEDEPDICPGERYMLINHVDDCERQIFSLISISPVANVGRTPCPLWQVVVNPGSFVTVTLFPIYIKDGTTEVFVFGFGINDGYRGIGLINEHKQFWLSSIFVKAAYPEYYVDDSGVRKDDKFVVRSPGNPSGPEITPMIIGVSNEQVHIQFDSGITMSKPLMSLPDGEDNLWPYLVSAIGPERVLKMQ